MTRTERVSEFFKSHPDEWIDGLTIAMFAGAYAWRSRISDARRLGMTIENRQRVSPTGRTVSEYRYVTRCACVEHDDGMETCAECQEWKARRA